MNLNSFQDFYQIRKECLKTGRNFKDPEFRPSPEILKHSSGHKNIVWKRPNEICSEPKFVVDGFSRYDVHQGFLGDCWFLAALETLSENKKLFHQVVPTDNTFDEENYAGVFHFNFWRAGKWISVVIDDRLPVYGGKLMFTQAKKNEFWPALIEKAYAKFYGSYGALEGGHSSEAMVDFTGGVVERYDLRQPPMKLFNIIKKAQERGSLISVAVYNGKTEEREERGIISGHAYSLTAARIINEGLKNEVKLVRIKNPWSDHHEWNGPYGDKSSEWNLVPKKIKEEMKVQFEDDGEFYMTYQEFLMHYDQVEFCHISPGQLAIEDGAKKWFLSECEGKFNYSRNYSTQVIVKLVDPDEYDDDDLCTLIVTLMRKNCREKFIKDGFIKFEIYELNENQIKQEFLSNEFFSMRNPKESVKFSPFRDVCARFRLMPGYYAIVPQAMSSTNLEFMLRLFTESMKHGETGKVIIKINEKPSQETFGPEYGGFTIKNAPPAAAVAPMSLPRVAVMPAAKKDTKINIFTIDDDTSEVSRSSRKRKAPKFCYVFYAIFLVIILMFASLALLIVYLDKGPDLIRGMKIIVKSDQCEGLVC